MNPPLLSFFTGGGFFDIGFRQARFPICWSNESNPFFLLGYQYGMSSWLSANRRRKTREAITNTNDVRDLSVDRILKEAFDGSRPKQFGVIGGPPCPDFSNGGKHAGANGASGALTTVFVDKICKLKPSFFVIENVPGLCRFRKHRVFLERKIRQLRECGFAVDFKVLNALELGVPQDRQRLFVIGFKKPFAERAANRKFTKSESGWFPWPSIDDYKDARMFSWPKTSPFGKKPVKPKGIPIELTVYPALIANGDPEAIDNGLEFFNPYSERFKNVREGDVGRKSFKRLHRYRYSPTAFYGNQEVHLHPWKPRRLSVREALRIQSVPDEYILPDEISLSAKFKMICNGVPCLMALQLAREIRAYLKRAN